MKKSKAKPRYESSFEGGRASLNHPSKSVAEILEEREKSSRRAPPAVAMEHEKEEPSPGQWISDLQYSLAGFLTENAALLAALRECSPTNPLACDDDLRTRLRKKGREAFDKERTWEAAILVGNQADIHLL